MSDYLNIGITTFGFFINNNPGTKRIVRVCVNDGFYGFVAHFADVFVKVIAVFVVISCIEYNQTFRCFHHMQINNTF